MSHHNLWAHFPRMFLVIRQSHLVICTRKRSGNVTSVNKVILGGGKGGWIWEKAGSFSSSHPSFVCRSMGVALSLVLCLGGVRRVYAICLQRWILLRNFGAAEMNLLQGKEAPRMGWGITEKIKGEHIQGWTKMRAKGCVNAAGKAEKKW